MTSDDFSLMLLITSENKSDFLCIAENHADAVRGTICTERAYTIS